ncbi:putative quinol monooxygenase [Denitromonas iodatirespirans]|uniref:Antibiotic biosynthesis monooxygenase n=1 Tax=Denitromonas iodatirespirans TaxID=2795389 RepID=A0A944D6V7_DENI1|nr:antibiotic biosynthesis monooxygenase family protein [Denitromonas iodatirespirans]MBT0961034.1 antibiotic biosynthesis monooxygenase [Denitromonas iodatirespirans]
MTTNVIITFTAKPEKLAAFTDILQSVKTELPKVDGCIAVDVFNDTANPCVFTLVETWQSESAHKAHIEGVVSSGGWSHIASHLACDPSSSYFKAL